MCAVWAVALHIKATVLRTSGFGQCWPQHDMTKETACFAVLSTACLGSCGIFDAQMFKLMHGTVLAQAYAKKANAGRNHA